MGSINDKYLNQIEHSLLLNSDPLDNYEIVDDNLFIIPKTYSKPEISDSEKQAILCELADDLRHYGLEMINSDASHISVKAGEFEMDIPKNLVIPYDDAIFATILKQHHSFHQKGHKNLSKTKIGKISRFF